VRRPRRQAPCRCSPGPDRRSHCEPDTAVCGQHETCPSDHLHPKCPVRSRDSPRHQRATQGNVKRTAFDLAGMRQASRPESARRACPDAMFGRPSRPLPSDLTGGRLWGTPSVGRTPAGSGSAWTRKVTEATVAGQAESPPGVLKMPIGGPRPGPGRDGEKARPLTVRKPLPYPEWRLVRTAGPDRHRAVIPERAARHSGASPQARSFHLPRTAGLPWPSRRTRGKPRDSALS
jgi:hypothetical protein